MCRLIITLFILMIFSVPAFADYVETRTLTIPVQNITELEIDAGAGLLEIVGYDNLTQIEVKAEIELEGVSKNDALEYIKRYGRLDLVARGSTARLESSFEDNNSGNFFTLFSNRSAVINLLVKIPKNLSLDIDDGSGDMTIENTASGIIISDGSGNIAIENIGGSLRISDGSGDINIRQIKGDIEIDDGSGEIEIREITGDVDINDGSGDMIVREINGTVTVDDGSGEIEIDGVRQDVEIESSGSGGESITNVDGHVSGDVDYGYRRRHR
jgi:hypothetical protein